MNTREGTVPLGFTTILTGTIVAGLIAGACAAAFHFGLTEPVIEQAIALEEAGAGDHSHKAPIVSRELQRVGLFVGILLYGTFWAFLVGIAFFAGQHALAGLSRFWQGTAFGLLGAWSLGIFPFLKYPALPPGVGEPETIVLRQTLYLVFLVLSVGGVALALAGWQASGQTTQWSQTQRALVALGGYALYAAVLYGGMPANTDPVNLPGELIGRFQALSVMGMGVFWLTLGLVFGVMLRRADGDTPTRQMERAPIAP